MTELTSFDKSLLNLLQGNLPVCSHPFARLAEELGSDEDTVLSRLRELKRNGYLRRIGTFSTPGAWGIKEHWLPCGWILSGFRM